LLSAYSSTRTTDSDRHFAIPKGVPLVSLLETPGLALLLPNDPNADEDPMSEVRLSTGALRRSHDLALGFP